MFETFEHTADLGLRVRADDLEQLFDEAAKGLFSMIVANLDSVRPLQEETFCVAGKQLDYLLFDWLNELLFIYETKHLLLVEFAVQFTEVGLEGTARGEPIDRARHSLDHEVKAITYHHLKVEQSGDGWMAEVIVDI